MQIINDSSFSLAKIVSRINPPKYSVTFIVKGTCVLTSGGQAELVEESDPPLGDIFVENDPEKSCIHESDFAVYKPGADLTLSGKCHSPGKKPVQGCRVTFQVGEYKKSLYVFGDRQWKRSSYGTLTSTEPESFTELSLIYENSFGGPDYKKNPYGKGAAILDPESGMKVRPLPNIEDPRCLIVSPDERPDPVGFAPLGRMWPDRIRKVGTYDEQWYQKRWPYFPVDFDWSYFNHAPPGMQMSQYLHGDEALYFENLHPRIPHYYSQLPCVRVRCFIHEKKDEEYFFKEVKLNLDTLWVNMEEESLSLVWRGITEIATEDPEEIAYVLVASEPLEEEPKPFNHYLKMLKQQLEEQEDVVDSESEVDLQPVDDSWIEKLEADFVRMEEEFEKLELQLLESEKIARKMFKEAGLDPAKLDQAEKIAQNLKLREVLTQAAEQEKEHRKAHPESADKFPPPMTAEEIAEIEKEFQFEPFPELDAFPEPMTREGCEILLSGEKIFDNEDLSSLDLGNLDFSRCACRNTDFRLANLQGVNFEGADLSGANLSGCDLSGLSFRGAQLVEADLSRTNLESTDLSDAVIDDADFSSAILENANLEKAHGFRALFIAAVLKDARLANTVLREADFEGADLESANFEYAVLQEASIEGVRAKRINMQSSDLTGLHASEGPDLSGGIFKDVKAGGSIWEEAILEGADFSGADLKDADFTNARLKQACFMGADLRMARFEKADLTDTNMKYINLFQGSLEKSSLIRTDLSYSNLYEVEFYLAEIQDALFDHANLKMTKLEETR